MASRKGMLIFGAVLGLVILVAGAYIGFKILPDYLKYQVAEDARLEPGSEQFKRWENPPYSIPFQVYVFNVINPKEVAFGEKPEVVQLGPYIYNQKIIRENVSHDFSTGTIKYTQSKKYVFDKEKSHPYTEDDKITVLNVPMNALFQIIENIQDVFIRNLSLWLLNRGLSAFNVGNTNCPHSYSMFTTIKVKEYLFSGYQFCKSKELNEAFVLCFLIRTLGTHVRLLHIKHNSPILFSFFNQRQSSNDGVYNISSGIRIIRDLGNIISWNNLKYTDYWSGKNSDCDRVQGTDSTIFSPFKDINSVLTVYNTDICRYTEFFSKKGVEYKGTKGYHAVIDEMTYASAHTCPKLSCFCTKIARNLDGVSDCQPDGFLDLSNCIGIHLLASHPHQLWAAEYYTKTVIGQEPSQEHHASFIDIEPNTGLPLKKNKRLQYNMIIRPIEDIDITRNISKAVIPILWVDEGMELPEYLLDYIADTYLRNIPIIEVTKWTLIGIGTILCIGCSTAITIMRLHI